ncbi:hypothetical protein [Kitasatospora cheerisanensis]|uniref:Uncharacterized protein n=1 Tax=Kitasatospora cheerisanensis KCTC 2395 TaxID=1348663 RepID=A0A066Z742_9ACTN|nr:hypothetical protein [Kitasatospora cheerisanensis]KDN86136.1 hypothetical protein KCH_19530 [Kitasatospora cheerisanensis KCTC 2395]
MGSDENRGTAAKARQVPPPQLPPGPLREFKEYLYRLYLDAGAPTLAGIAAAVGERDDLPGAPGKDTVARILRGDTLPGRDDAVSVAAVLAVRAGRPPEEAQEAVRARWAEASAHRPARPRTLRQWEPSALGVRPAPAADGSDRGTHTEYVERAHDRELCDQLRQAAGGGRRRSLLAVLAGAPGSGRTRAAFRAIEQVLPDWPLLNPARGPEELLALVAAGAVPARTVLWLDDLARYLDGGTGEDVATVLAALLDRAAPVVVIGTIRTDQLRRLTDRPGPAGDRHPRARALLNTWLTELDVPDSMAGHLPELAEKATRDPRLAAALRAAAADGRVLQHLTGGPVLVRRYEQGPGHFFTEIEHALISAAADARRIGHAGPLPPDLLAEAVGGYLPDTARVTADGWLIAAVEALCRPSDEHGHRGLAALAAVRETPGLGAADGYRVTDYLARHLRRRRGHLCPPATLWDAVAHHTRTTDDLDAVAAAARARRRYGHALHLYRRSADEGSRAARAAATALLAELGDRAGAERAAADDPRAWMLLATATEAAGDRAAAERAYAVAAEHGEPLAWATLVRLHEERQDPDGAEELASRALLLGHPQAWTALARLREHAADHEGAARAYQEAAWGGDAWAWTGLSRVHRNNGDLADAELTCLEAAVVGAVTTGADLVRCHWEAGDRAAAEAAAERAGQAGTAEGWTALARLREGAGDPAGAEAAHRRAAALGTALAWAQVARLRETAGDPAGADDAADRAARLGDAYAWSELARLREHAGDRTAADHAAGRAARAGDPEAWTALARLRESAGDRTGADLAATRAAAHGDPEGWAALSRIRERAGDREAAELAVREAVAAGGDGAWTALGRVREHQDPEAAARAYRHGTELGDADAWAALGRLHEQDGDRVGAQRAYGHAVDGGDCGAWEGLRRVARADGPPHHGPDRRPYGLTAAGAPADRADVLRPWQA